MPLHKFDANQLLFIFVDPFYRTLESAFVCYDQQYSGLLTLNYIRYYSIRFSGFDMKT